MSKNGFAGHCEKVAAHHAALGKGFTGLASSFQKLAGHSETASPEMAEEYSGAAEKCKAMAAHHDSLAEAHTAIGEEAQRMIDEKAQKTVRRDGAHGTLTDAPADQRNRPFINRTGGAPDQRKAAPSFDHLTGKVDVSRIDPELADLVNDPAS